MAVCPNCNYEYVEGVKVCPDCGMELAPKEDVLLDEEWTSENWEVVYTCDQEYEAEMLKDNLTASGIKAIVLSQKDNVIPAVGDFAYIKIMVHKDNLSEAQAYIEKYQNDGFTSENLEDKTTE